MARGGANRRPSSTTLDARGAHQQERQAQAVARIEKGGAPLWSAARLASSWEG
jgi:hypothetical protein